MPNPTVSLISTFLLLLAAAIGGGVLLSRVKLPTIIGYITGGIIVGNLMPTFIDHHIMHLVAEAGVTLLLFTLGVEFSFHRLRKILSAMVWPALLQVILTFFVVFLLLMFLGISFVASMYLAAAVSLSSTAIVIKLLSEKGELDSVPGETATGWLVIQDLAVVPMLILLTALASVSIGEGTIFSVASAIFVAIGKAAVLILAILYLGGKGVPRLFAAISSFGNRELFLLCTIGFVFFVSILTFAAGLPVALGAFLAGLLIAETSQNHAVFAEVRPLRDLFAVIFFVSLGMKLPLSSLSSSWPVIVLLSLSAIGIKGFLMYLLLRYGRFHRKTSMLVVLFLMPVSEFGFIVAQSGVAMGALSQIQSGILIAVTFISIVVSAPLIMHAHEVYYRIHAVLRKFPKFFAEDAPELAKEGYPIANHVVICGYGRVGKYIGRALAMTHIPFLVVDYNHNTLKRLKESGITTIYGDPADKGVLDFAQVDYAKAIVIAIPDRHTQNMVIANAQSLNRRIKIICRTHHEEDQRYLKSLGVHTIVQPEFEAALRIIEKLLSDFGVPESEQQGKISRLKIEHGT